jgi:hypothetical protein
MESMGVCDVMHGNRVDLNQAYRKVVPNVTA